MVWKVDGRTIDIMAKVLVMAEDESTRDGIVEALRSSGLDVVDRGTGKGGLDMARSLGPDLLVCDMDLPDMDGFEVCKRLRRDPLTERIPVVMVSGRATEMDRVLALELGADDFVAKPFSARELVLRVRRSMARSPALMATADVLSFGELMIDVPGHRVLVKGRGVDVTATEFRLLTVMARRRGRVQTREQLLQEVWTSGEREAIDERTVDTHVRRLRDKLGEAAGCVETVRGVGYRFAS